MPVEINGMTMYKTREACKLAGTNVHTFFRWVRQGKFADVDYRDGNGWRLFTDADVSRLRDKVQKTYRISVENK
jgi:predicted site-specific integrase-resolvase